MSLPEVTTVCFPESGPANTDATLALGLQRALTLGLKDVVVASTSGATGVRAATLFAGFNVIVVNGIFAERLDSAAREPLASTGAHVVFAGHAFGMMGRAVKRRLGAVQADEIVAQTLKIFGDGFKVAVEVTCMAVDAGLIPPGREVVAIGGYGRGADTAIVIRAAHTQDFFDTHILEVICKPR